MESGITIIKCDFCGIIKPCICVPDGDEENFNIIAICLECEGKEEFLEDESDLEKLLNYIAKEYDSKIEKELEFMTIKKFTYEKFITHCPECDLELEIGLRTSSQNVILDNKTCASNSMNWINLGAIDFKIIAPIQDDSPSSYTIINDKGEEELIEEPPTYKWSGQILVRIHDKVVDGKNHLYVNYVLEDYEMQGKNSIAMLESLSNAFASLAGYINRQDEIIKEALENINNEDTENNKE